MKPASTTSRFLVAFLLCGTGLGLSVGPASVNKHIHDTICDVARPGQLLLNDTIVWFNVRHAAWVTASEQQTKITEIHRELLQWKLRARRAEVAAALAQQQANQLQSNGVSPYAVSATAALIKPKLIEAVVLGRPDTSPIQRRRLERLISGGSRDGVGEEDFVLEATELLLDQGDQDGIAAGQPAFSGRTVIGKIARTGWWTSTVQLVTDEKYRGFASLARHSPDGPVFAAEGILEGTGKKTCRLKFVDSGEAVRVGDAVYTNNRDSMLPNSMYYGEVIHAELKPGAPHWEIVVRPAIQPEELRKVNVLIQTVNRERLLAN